MNPAEIARATAAKRGEAVERLLPKIATARAASQQHWQKAKELKTAIKDNQNERELIQGHNFDLFPTPPELAAEMVRRARVGQGDLVLEPSAGTGRIAKAAKEAGAWVTCVEFNQSLISRLRDIGDEVYCKNFLEYESSVKFNVVLMNPPFSNGADIDHVRHAYDIFDEGDLIAIMSEGSFYRSDKKATAFRQWLDEVGGESEQLPPNTFKQSGTGVNARIVTIKKHQTSKLYLK